MRRSAAWFSAILLAFPNPGVCGQADSSLNDRFFQAVRSQDLQRIRDCLAQGADFNAKGINGDFALDEAVNLGDSNMFKLLMDKGANVNLSDDFGDTALISAAKNDRIEVIKPLLAKGADVHAAHDAALLTAVDHAQLEIVRELLAAGADANAKNKDGQTILMHTVGGSAPVLAAILSAGAKLDVNAADNDGVTLVMYAAGGCSMDSVQLLLDKGANLKSVDHDGNTVLMHLPLNSFGEAVPGISAMIKFLASKGVDVNAKDRAGQTALLQAVHQHVTEAGGTIAHANVVQSLLDAGADPGATNADGDTALHEILRAIPSNPEVARLLINRGSDVAAANQLGQTPLMLAAQMGNVEIVQLLLSKHADRSVHAKDGSTALSLAEAAKSRAVMPEDLADRLAKVISILSAPP